MRCPLRVTACALLVSACAGEAPPVLPAASSTLPASSVAPTEVARPVPAGECAVDADCVLVAYEADAPKPCCTCTLRAVPVSEAKRIEKVCSAPPPPNTPLRDTICIQSCLRAPGLAARCVYGTCAMR